MTDQEPDIKEHHGIVYKEIKRTPNMRKVAPPITWGDKFNAMPIEDQLDRAKKVASAMNHAADVLQKERNNLLETCADQDRKIAHAQKIYLQQGELFHKQLQKENAKQQELNQLLVEKTMEISRLEAEVKRLSAIVDGFDRELLAGDNS